MTARFQILLTLLVILGDLYMVKQIHRKRMSLNYSLLWLGISLLMLIMILFPNIIYRLSHIVGIDMPINMLFLGYAVFSMVLLFYLTGIASKLTEKNRRLTQ